MKIHRLFVIAVILTAPIALDAQSSFARMQGDSLVLGNALIQRSFSWNGGNLITRSVTDLHRGITRKSSSSHPDFVFDENEIAAPGATLEQFNVPQTAIRPSHLLVRVSFTLASLEVRREFRIYEGVPAIACDTYLRGSAPKRLLSAEQNNADKSNIENLSVTRGQKRVTTVLDRLELEGRQWKCKAVEFWDVTDWNNTLVQERSFISYNRAGSRGNLLFVSNMQDQAGFWFLKEAPCSGVQLSYTGQDFFTEYGKFTVTGLGLTSEDLSMTEWTPAYSCVIGVCGTDEYSQLSSLRKYQKMIRRHLPQRDEMVMMNTWGDRNKDAKVNEAFCLSEIEKAARLGITVFQIDDGWQQGKSQNSAFAGGSFKDIWANPLYWTVDPAKYPNGLSPIVRRGDELGVKVGLWFNPSIQDEFDDWEKDAGAVLKLYRQYGITIFKIDGVALPTKKAEMNLKRFFDRVQKESNNEVVFNLDVTAGRRGGYHYFGEYGNTFMENRYTDWQNYYPYWTLRNLWMLSRYVPAEKLQVEFLNIWRNKQIYSDDIFAPCRYDFDYIFAISMAGQPLAWMEASNLPEEAYDIVSDVEAYKKVMGRFHQGIILPIGEEPSGRSWTGFQSVVSDTEGYVLVFRELNEDKTKSVDTFFPQGAKISFDPICGHGKKFLTRCKDGKVCFSLDKSNSFALYKYTIR